MSAGGVVFQCGACRALTLATSVVVDDGRRAGLPCGVCGALTMLPVAGAAAGGPSVVVDADAAARATPPSRALPAATALVPTTSSSPSSSASSSTLSPEQRTRIVARTDKLPAADGDEQAALAAGFVALLERWDDPAEHDRLLKKASLTEQLAFVGQRYRAVLEEAPGDAAAKRAQNDLMTLAMASLTAHKDLGSVGEGRGRNTTTLMAAAVLLLLLLAAAIWFVPRLLPPSDGAATMSGAKP